MDSRGPRIGISGGIMRTWQGSEPFVYIKGAEITDCLTYCHFLTKDCAVWGFVVSEIFGFTSSARSVWVWREDPLCFGWFVLDGAMSVSPYCTVTPKVPPPRSLSVRLLDSVSRC